ncbi:MAG TPA: VOC family protein [Chitinophagaceae bacterium]|jgi:predicted 3-demethylubiquinone-9 3-methyltransferase (glyoxalase superfamily)|nr:VOC family protein [Chitinophagaceae bacterium]
MQKITPYLWFDNNAEEAISFYSSIFKDSKMTDCARWGKGGPVPEGTIMTATFELAGQKFLALNGGPMFKFNEAVSFLVDCKDQEEVDYYWNKLTEGGAEQPCGWLKDKYGLSWQIIPRQLSQLIGHKDREKAGRALQAMMQMKKIDVAKLEAAFEGK